MLVESLDTIDALLGWDEDSVLLAWLVVFSLLQKIRNSEAQKLRRDQVCPTWDNLFALLRVTEELILHRPPRVAGVPRSEPSPMSLHVLPEQDQQAFFQSTPASYRAGPLVAGVVALLREDIRVDALEPSLCRESSVVRKEKEVQKLATRELQFWLALQQFCEQAVPSRRTTAGLLANQSAADVSGPNGISTLGGGGGSGGSLGRRRSLRPIGSAAVQACMLDEEAEAAVSSREHLLAGAATSCCGMDRIAESLFAPLDPSSLLPARTDRNLCQGAQEALGQAEQRQTPGEAPSDARGPPHAGIERPEAGSRALWRTSDVWPQPSRPQPVRFLHVGHPVGFCGGWRERRKHPAFPNERNCIRLQSLAQLLERGDSPAAQRFGSGCPCSSRALGQPVRLVGSACFLYLDPDWAIVLCIVRARLIRFIPHPSGFVGCRPLRDPAQSPQRSAQPTALSPEQSQRPTPRAPRDRRRLGRRRRGSGSAQPPTATPAAEPGDFPGPPSELRGLPPSFTNVRPPPERAFAILPQQPILLTLFPAPLPQVFGAECNAPGSRRPSLGEVQQGAGAAIASSTAATANANANQRGQPRSGPYIPVDIAHIEVDDEGKIPGVSLLLQALPRHRFAPIPTQPTSCGIFPPHHPVLFAQRPSSSPCSYPGPRPLLP